MMKSVKVLITIMFTLLMLIACENNQGDLTQSNNVEEAEMIKEYKPADFNLWEEWFSGFDPEHIYNFHYVILTDHHNRIPGPTDDRIEGFFNISEDEWDNYINDDTEWTEPWADELNRINAAPDILGMRASELNWIGNLNWIIRHRGERVGGSLLICKENRLVWFSLSR